MTQPADTTSGAPSFSNYEDAAAYQLQEWVAGRPWHNPLSPDGNARGKCCVDFSCCCPELLSDQRWRLAYLEAGPADRAKMEEVALQHARVHKGIMQLGKGAGQ